MKVTNVNTSAYPISITYTFKNYHIEGHEIRAFKETLEKFDSVKLYSESSLLNEYYIELRARSTSDIEEFEKEFKA